jgi:hypothetical protein
MIRIVVAASALALSAPAFAVLIDFELGGPDLFSQTNPLRDEYLGQGVRFFGPNSTGGGAVLNDSTWGANAISGTDILAFNVNSTMQNGGTPTGPETIRFVNAPAASVSIWYSGSSTSASNGVLRAYDAADNLLGSDSDNSAAGGWVQLSLSGVGDIAYVTIDSTNDPTWMLDDLNFTPVPEPATLAALGLGALALVRKRKKA